MVAVPESGIPRGRTRRAERRPNAISGRSTTAAARTDGEASRQAAKRQSSAAVAPRAIRSTAESAAGCRPPHGAHSAAEELPQPFHLLGQFRLARPRAFHDRRQSP